MPAFVFDGDIEITAASQNSALQVEKFGEAIIGFSDQIVGIISAADDDDECPVAQAYAAMLYTSSDTNSGVETARKYLARARQVENAATPREKAIIAGAEAWCNRQQHDAALIFEQIAEDNPTDLLSAKWAQGLHFDCGNSAGILRAPLKVAKHCNSNPHLHGLLAFGYEECHMLDDAERSVQRSLKLDRTVAWSHHAMAHICEGRNALDEGLAFMQEHSDTWQGLTSFMSTHNWWHYCLLLLDLNRGNEVLQIYDNQIWGLNKGFVQDQINAISMLYRLERTGIDVGQKRWEDVACHVAPNADSQLSVFLDMQFLYALARTGRNDANQMVKRIADKAEMTSGSGELAWKGVAVYLAPAIVALADRDYITATKFFERALPSLQSIGGSHAQRDLVQLFYLDSLRGAQNWEKVQQLLAERYIGRPKTSWIRSQLGYAYEKLGLDEINMPVN